MSFKVTLFIQKTKQQTEIFSSDWNVFPQTTQCTFTIVEGWTETSCLTINSSGPLNNRWWAELTGLHWVWVWFCPGCSSPRCCWPCGFRWQPGLAWALRAGRPGPASAPETGESPDFDGSPSTRCRSAHPGSDWPTWDLQGKKKRAPVRQEVCNTDYWVKTNSKVWQHRGLWVAHESRVILQRETSSWRGKTPTLRTHLVLHSPHTDCCPWRYGSPAALQLHSGCSSESEQHTHTQTLCLSTQLHNKKKWYQNP